MRVKPDPRPSDPEPPSPEPPSPEPASPAPAAPVERRGGAGPRAVAEISDRLTRRSLGKRGFAEGTLIAQWPTIVGGMLGQWTLPLKIVFPPGERVGGTLHVRAASGAVATEVQHLAPLVIQRINGHFGYGAVARLALHQGPIPQRRKPARTPPALSEERQRELAHTLDQVDDADLREVLARLGRWLG